jgi:hypothetical protein
LNSIQGHIKAVLKKNFPEGGKEVDVLDEIKNVFLYGFLHLFKKCTQKIRELGTVNLYQQDLNNYNVTEYEEKCLSGSLGSNVLEASNELLKAVAEYVKERDNFVFHFDEIQKWAVDSWFARNNEHFVLPGDFYKYYLLGLSNAMTTFKGTPIRFIISGTNIEQGTVLRISSQVKTEHLYLPLFSEESTLEMLKQLCNIQHLDEEELRDKIAKPLAGCARSCEYFFSDILQKLRDCEATKVTVTDLEKVDSCSFVINA